MFIFLHWLQHWSYTLKYVKKYMAMLGIVTTTPPKALPEEKFTMLVWQEDQYDVILRKKAPSNDQVSRP